MLQFMGLFPAFLDLTGEQAVVIGGGAVALRRAKGLLNAGLKVRVIAPQLLPEFEKLAVSCQRRTYQAGDLVGAKVVIVATNNLQLNDLLAAEAKALGMLVNHAGQADLGNLRFGALAGSGTVQVAVNTGYKLPMLARALAQHIETLLPAPQQVADWASQREQALRLPEPQCHQALATLKQNIEQVIYLDTAKPFTVKQLTAKQLTAKQLTAKRTGKP